MKKVSIEHIEKSIENALAERSNLTPEILNIRGFSTNTQRHLMNNLTNINGCYLEVGLFAGATFCSSFNDICISIGVEDHSQDFSVGFDKIKIELKENIEKFHGIAKEVHVHYTDCFKMDKSVLPPIDILFYDGEHSFDSTQKSLPNFIDNLSDTAIVLYDDTCWGTVSSGIEAAFKQVEDKLTIVKKWDLVGASRHEDPIWWNGVQIYLINKK